VILSLENHCSVEQQKTMAQLLISILGSALVTKPLGDQMPTRFPSPEVSDCGMLHRGCHVTQRLIYRHIQFHDYVREIIG